MHKPLREQLLRETTRYLSGAISLRDFNRWFSPVLWSVEQCRDEHAEELAYEIVRLLSEYAQGEWSEEQLRHLLKGTVAAQLPV